MRWTCLLTTLAALAATAPAGAAVLFDTDFGEGLQPVLEQGGQPNPRATGVLPGEWRDNTSWAPIWTEYTAMEEEGRAYVRVDPVRLEGAQGWAQISHDLPAIDAETFYVLEMTARSVDHSVPQMGIRLRGQPYTWLWQVQPGLSGSWSDLRYEFRLPPNEAPVGFYLALNDMGSIDLQHAELRAMSREEYVEELRRRYPEGGPANLLAVSRFPLGLQNGWNLGRDLSDGDDVGVAPDPTLTGPSGAPALRIEPQRGFAIHTAPFAVPLAFDPHTASVYARGSGTITLRVYADGQRLAEQAAPLAGDDWQRVAVTFDPRLMARGYVVQVSGDQAAWLDAMQVNSGSEPTDYTAQLAAEVSLSLPPSDASRARVQFMDEPASMQWAVTGEVPGAMLRARVVNPYGDERNLGPYPLGGDFLTAGELSFAAFPERPAGPLRVEAWVENAAGERISAYNELVVHRLPRPRYWGQDAPDSPFGVHVESTTRHVQMAKAMGINWTRLHDAGLQYIGWYHLERQPGEWTFYDEAILRYRRGGLTILGELGTAPEWASYHPGRNVNGYFDRFYQPKDLTQYADYVSTVARRYDGVIAAWDVWNEPWIHAWWPVGHDETVGGRDGYYTSEQPQADFAKLQQTAFETVNAIEPDMAVLGINTTTGGGGTRSFSGSDWTAGVVAAGGLETCDAIAYHCYLGGRVGWPGDAVTEGLARALDGLGDTPADVAKPVWMTEGAAARDSLGSAWYHYSVPWEQDEDVWETADRQMRYLVSLLGSGVERVFLYSMHTHGFLGQSGSFRALVNEDGYLHPSGAAHGVLASLLEDTEPVRVTELADGVFAYLFAGREGRRPAGYAVAALSTAPEHAEYTLPARGVALTDLFGNPVPGGAPLGLRLTYAAGRDGVDALETALRQR